MDDLQTDTLPQPSAETPAGGASAETDLELELETEAVGDDQAEGADDELEDWEEEGKTYKVPKPLKPYLLRNKDYTQKTTEIAATRKEIEAQRAEFEETQKFHRENIREIAKVENLGDQLAAFRAITREQWAAMDPTQASKLQIELNLLKDQYESAVGGLRQKQHQALEKQRHGAAKQYEDGMARIAKKIPGWSDDKAGKLNAYAVENGFSLDELQSFIPRKNAEAYVSVLDKAYLYDQLMARTRAKAKAEETPATIQPVPTVSTRRSTSNPLPSDKDDIGTWVRKEQARMKRKAEARA